MVVGGRKTGVKTLRKVLARSSLYITVVMASTFVQSQENLDLDTQDLNDELDELLSGTLDQKSPGTSAELGLIYWKGFVEVKPRSYLNDRNQFKNDEQLIISSEFELDFQIAQNMKMYLRPRSYIDAADDEIHRFETLEAHVTYEQINWDLRIGQFIENWGIADTYNPIDIINRRDLATEILDPDRLGEWGMRGRWLFEGNGLIGEPIISVYILPFFQETRFASDEQRFGLGNSVIEFKERRGFEPNGSEESMYALRYQSTLNTRPANSDIQLLIARGPERNPFITSLNQRFLVPVYFGSQTLGAGIRSVPNADSLGDFLSGFTFKLELVYKDNYTFDNSPLKSPDDYTAYVLGFDRDFYNVFNSQDQITLTIEFADELGVDADDIVGNSRAFSRDIISRLFWQAGDFSRSSIELRSVYDIEVDEYVVESTFATSLLNIHKDLKMEAHLQYFEASNSGNGFYSSFRNNTSVAMSLRLEF